MSASREKKYRQGDLPLTEKERKAQQEEAAARRNKILYIILGVVVSVAVIVLLVWDSGFFQRRTVAATIGGVEYTVADVSFYYNQTKNNFINQSEYYKEQLGYDVFGYDTTKTPAEQTYATDEATGEVTTYQDFFREGALENLKQVAALAAAAKADGYEMSEEAKTSLATQSDQIDQLASQYNNTRDGILKNLYGTMVTEELFQKNLALSILASDYQTNYQNSIDTSDSALDAYYKAHSADLDSYTYHYASIKGSVETGTDADGKAIEATEEQKTAAKEDAKTRADAMLTAVRGGADFDAVAKDYVSELEKDAYTAEGATLRSGIAGSSLSALNKSWFQDAARKDGDVELFEDAGNNGYVLVQYVSQGRDDTESVNVRHILIKPESEEDAAAEFTDEQWAAAETKAQGILDQYLAGDKTAEAFGELAEANSGDGRTEAGALSAAGGLYENVKPGDMVTEFNDWCFDAARQVGDTGLVKTSYGWHIMYYQGTNHPIWKDTAKSALTSDLMNAWTEEKTAGYDIVEAAGMAQVK